MYAGADKQVKGVAMASESCIVRLTTEYEVDLAEENGLEHLYNAAICESMRRVRLNDPPKDDHGDAEGLGAFQLVYDLATLEVHYVAGQLLEKGSSIGIARLMHELPAHWDRLAEWINRKMAENSDVEDDDASDEQ
jgi:hypothetical protein